MYVERGTRSRIPNEPNKAVSFVLYVIGIVLVGIFAFGLAMPRKVGLDLLSTFSNIIKDLL
jgi:hypothetical protein